MSRPLNIISTNLQGYGPPETISLPCFGVSGSAISISPCPGSKFKSFQAKVISAKCSFKHASFICKAGSGGQRRNPDLGDNRNILSPSRNNYNEERDNSENLDESEFVSTTKGRIFSLSNNSKPIATDAPGEKERDIVELFRKVQAKLRQKVAVKEEKKLAEIEVKSKVNDSVDSILNLLTKHTAEKGQRKVNGGNGSEVNVDRTRPTTISKRYIRKNVVKEELQETHRPSVGRPVSNFRRKSPVPGVKYESIVSSEDTYDSLTQTELDVNMNSTHYEPVADFESDFDLESEIDITSGLELEEEEVEEEEEEEDEELEEPLVELDPENEFVDETATSNLLKADNLDVEEVVNDERDTGKQRIELNDLNSMKIVELKALAKARGMHGFSKLNKSELVRLLSDDS